MGGHRGGEDQTSDDRERGNDDRNHVLATCQFALFAQGVEKLLDGQTSFRDQTAKRAPGDFRVVGYRERRNVTRSCHDHMTAFLPNHAPTKSLKGLDDVGGGKNRNGRHYTTTST